MEELVAAVHADLAVPRVMPGPDDLVAQYTACVIRSRDLLVDEARARLAVSEARVLYNDAPLDDEHTCRFLKARLAEAKVHELTLHLQIAEIDRFMNEINDFMPEIVDMSREAETGVVQELVAKYVLLS
jgi:hypothetical protein